MSSSIATTGRSLVDHWHWAAEKGLMNRHTAAALRTACVKVLGAADQWEEVDVGNLDVEDAFHRFQTTHGKDYKPQTLEEYHRRFAQAVDSFLEYVRDPSGWHPSKARVTTPRKTTRKPTTNQRLPGATADQGTVEPLKGYMEYDYRLPGDRTAILRLPSDLTLADVRRIEAFLATLATDFEPAEG